MRIDTDLFDEHERVEASGVLDRYLEERVREVNRRDLVAWRELKSVGDWEAFKAPRVKALEPSLGTCPEVPVTIEAEVMRTIEVDGYTNEALGFESRAGIRVTANARAVGGGYGCG